MSHPIACSTIPLLLILVLLHIVPSTCDDLADPSYSDSATTSPSSLLSPGVHVIPCASPSPSPCARVWLPSFLDPSTTPLLLSLANSAFSLTPGGSGPVTIIDLVSGALSYRDRFVSAFALQREKGLSFPSEAVALYWALTARMKGEIQRTLNVTDPIFLTKPSFIAQIDGDKEVVTQNDEYYHPHIDTQQYGAFHYTALLYLSTHGEEFEGGEFVFKDSPSHSPHPPAVREAEVTSNGEVDSPHTKAAGDEVDREGGEEWVVRPSKGSVLFFTSGEENVHYVRRVTRGRRTTLTIAFTKNEADSVEEALHSRYGQQVNEWKAQQHQEGEDEAVQ